METQRNTKKKAILVSILSILFIFSLVLANMTSSHVEAASKKYTKTYNLKRNCKKVVKVKSKIKSVKSSNKKVVTVKKSGKKFTITTKKKGSAVITVKCKNKKTYKYKVKVSNKEYKEKKCEHRRWHNQKIVAPTCTTDGYGEDTCKDCGEVGRRTTPDYKAPGHNWVKPGSTVHHEAETKKVPVAHFSDGHEIYFSDYDGSQEAKDAMSIAIDTYMKECMFEKGYGVGYSMVERWIIVKEAYDEVVTVTTCSRCFQQK